MRASLTACSRAARVAVSAIVASVAVSACQNSSIAPSNKSAPGPVAVVQPIPPPPEPVRRSPPPPPVVESKKPPEVLLPPKGPDETRVALLLPLSGKESELGEALLNGALLAQFDLAEDNFMLAPFDTRGTPEGGAEAAERAVAAGADLVVGPLFSSVVRSAAPIVLAANVNMLAFSNDSAVAQPGVFLAGLLPETQIEKIVGYASSRGIRRYAALLPVGPFGERVQEALRETVRRYGRELVLTRLFDSEPESIRTAVKALGSAVHQPAAGTGGTGSFDALLIAARGAELTRIAAQLGNQDIDGEKVQILGLSGWSEDNAGFEPALAGAWFAAIPNSFSQDFRAEFKNMFGASAHTLGYLSYDMVALAAVLAASGNENAFSRELLADSQGFAGAGGVFRFAANGRPQHLLEVREIKSRQIVQIDPSPMDFETLSN